MDYALVAGKLAPAGRKFRRLPPFFATKRVAIVGCTDSHIHTPWFDPRWTIISHPSAGRLCRREPDWWMDMHGRPNFTQYKWWRPGYYQWLQSLRQPIFMQQDWPEIPMAVRYPKERILAEFRPYFTNHVAWMIALAITEGATHLGLFGCEYAHKAERGRQRGSAEYWLGVFEGQGGHVVLPPGSTLMADPQELYGYQSHDEKGKLRDSYRALVKPTAPGPAVPDIAGLTVIDPNSDKRPPLMSPPPGIEIAWDRSGYTLHC